MNRVLMIAIAAVLAVIGVVGAISLQRPQQSVTTVTAPATKSPVSRFAPVEGDFSAVAPVDGKGQPVDMAPYRGKVLLVNLWATWCAPCIKELPTLDRLAAADRLDGRLGVIAVSQDSGPQASVDAFLDKLKVQDLGAYHDPKMALSGALGVQVMPTTILFDADGREVWRYVGDLDWTGEEASRLLAEVSPGTP